MWTLLDEGFIQKPTDFGTLTLHQVKLYMRRLNEHAELEEKNRRLQQRQIKTNQGRPAVVRMPRFKIH